MIDDRTVSYETASRDYYEDSCGHRVQLISSYPSTSLTIAYPPGENPPAGDPYPVYGADYFIARGDRAASRATVRAALVLAGLYLAALVIWWLA